MGNTCTFVQLVVGIKDLVLCSLSNIQRAINKDLTLCLFLKKHSWLVMINYGTYMF